MHTLKYLGEAASRQISMQVGGRVTRWTGRQADE